MAMSAERKLRALRAAHEWMGLYAGGSGGVIATGDTEGVAQEILDAYELLGNLETKVQHEVMVERVAKLLLSRHPDIPPAQICREARKQVVAQERRELTPA